MELRKLIESLQALQELVGDADVRILVTHPGTGENMLFDVEGADVWENPEDGRTVMIQNFPAEKEPHLKLVK